MLLSVQDFQPFDTIPNELVVEIFARALVVPPGETPDGKKPVTRMSLSHVCRRWKDILQSHVCIGVPEDHHFMLSKDVLESGELNSRIYSVAKFAGPLKLTIIFDMHFKESDWLENTSSLLSSFAVALGAAHCATIILRLLFFPLSVLEFVVTGSGCQAFTRITSLSIFQPLSNPTQRAAALTPRPTTPRFPILSRLALLDTENKSPLSIQSIQSSIWVWLFQPSICDNLLSLSVSPIRAADLCWLLLRVPRLLDLRVSKTADVLPTQPLIVHENVKKLSLGLDYSGSLVCCPNLTTLISPYRPVIGQTTAATSLTWDPKVNLTTLGHRFTGNITTNLASYGLDLSSLTRLCVIFITTNSLSQMADIVSRNLLPNLSHLSLRPSPPMEGYFGNTSSGSSIAPLALTANSLHELTRPRGGHPGLRTIDCRIPRRYESTTSALFHMVRLLRQAALHDSVTLDADVHEFSDPYSGLQSIEKLLDAVERSEVSLSEIAEKWTGFVKGVEKRVVPRVPAYELLTTVPAFWDLLKRLKDIFKGTPFDLHDAIIDRWKVEGELARRSRTKAKKQWRIGAAPNSSHWRFEGLYWGCQGDSLMHDLREQDHYYFSEYNDLVFDHGVDGFLGEPSEPVLRSLGVEC